MAPAVHSAFALSARADCAEEKTHRIVTVARIKKCVLGRRMIVDHVLSRKRIPLAEETSIRLSLQERKNVRMRSWPRCAKVNCAATFSKQADGKVNPLHRLVAEVLVTA